MRKFTVLTRDFKKENYEQNHAMKSFDSAQVTYPMQMNHDHNKKVSGFESDPRSIVPGSKNKRSLPKSGGNMSQNT